MTANDWILSYWLTCNLILTFSTDKVTWQLTIIWKFVVDIVYICIFLVSYESYIIQLFFIVFYNSLRILCYIIFFLYLNWKWRKYYHKLTSVILAFFFLTVIKVFLKIFPKNRNIDIESSRWLQMKDKWLYFIKMKEYWTRNEYIVRVGRVAYESTTKFWRMRA